MSDVWLPPSAPTGVALREREITLSADPTSAGIARHLLREFFVDVGRPDWIDAGELAVSEVVTNATLHAHTPMTLRLVAFPEMACVAVRDFSLTLPAARHYDAEATTGRGMALVSAVTLDCGVHTLDDGKVVWFCIGDTGEHSAEDLLDAWDIDPVGLGEIGADTDTEVVLLSLPATLWLAARQHHDSLLRELLLYGADHPVRGVDLVAADSARTLISSAVVAAVDAAQARGDARRPVPDGHPSPLPWVPAQLDLRLHVPVGSAGQFAALQDTLDVAERLAVEGELLAHPGLPEIVAVRDWVCEQVIAQLAGVPPTAWPGTAQQQFETAVHSRAQRSDPGDVSPIAHSDRGAIAADDANRIVAVSEPLAAILGWTVNELVGRRVVTIIPPELREAHVAGFSRHLLTGEARVLNLPLVLPVLCRDGTKINCRFLVERAPTTLGAGHYIAWIEPVDATSPEPTSD